MKRGFRSIVLMVVFLGVSSLALASQWPQLTDRLEKWQGDKEVVMPEGVDLFADPALAPVVELLLEQGFAVLPEGPSEKGLTLEVRETAAGKRLLLKRGSDNAIVAMEKIGPALPVTATPEPVVLQTPRNTAAVHQVTPVSAPQPRVLSVQHPQPVMTPGELMFEIPGNPVQVVSWAAGDGVELYLLYHDRVQHFRSRGNYFEPLESFKPSVDVSRGLRLTCGDLNGDGQPEIGAVWSEDVHDVSEGTDSLLHSWVLSTVSLKPISADLKGYVDLADNQGRLQRRESYAAFAPEILPLQMKNGSVVVGSSPLQTTSHLLYGTVAWPNSEQSLVWNDDQRLMLQARSKHQRIPGTTLLTDFGDYQGPYVSIPLKNPEYRSGFSATDQVLAKEVVLARRLVKRHGAVYTLIRGRSKGLPLVGGASGADRLVRIEQSGRGLQAQYPFAAVDAFILDFAVYGDPAQAVLLLNEKEDGSGTAYLRFQSRL
ncbi:FG-GAP repeat domain-containing protein [Desulfuromonas acetoxidans]|uniref:FG-GAP n=1 Tax=Desulfuromonas acetoxidans (strain DSM 684 / 11070) TaxID=281689 RepID=Q1JVA3_DESA6|nr:VCBS repeat-containing protein [Desulfuromonas acetoxidans]EAT14171.1 hypothetical protein Dace_0007 [Desulfuromonas acetoxidans DSM 684]